MSADARRAGLSFGARYGGAALVTGASAGIGEAFARRLAADGTDLVLVARRGDRLEALAAELTRAHGVTAHACALDLTLPDAVPRLVAFLEQRTIAIGIQVHNAGFGASGPLHEAVPEGLARMVDLHCRVPVAILSALLPPMIARRRGAVIVVASVAGYQLGPGSAVYSASKAFDLLLGESLWAELEPYGIDALALSPGYTHTEFHDAAGISRGAIPAWAWATADDVAAAGLKGLGRRASVVPGQLYQALCALVRLVPRGWMNRLAVPIFFRKLGRVRADDRRRPGV
ncbi:MAG: SDR family oxidoreductase [Candidatus Eisenbacteria bacterium]